jgi:4-hydroxy-tetrahydrodipicolinate reductase
VIPLVILGAAGRMGRAVDGLAAERGGFEVRARVDRAANFLAGPGVWTDDLAGSVRAGDVVVDFSTPDALRTAAAVCARAGAALVTGTTGLGPAEETALAEASRAVAVLRASNFSLGVAALRRVLATALDAAPAEWDVEIVERHHRRKADSPSGTALTLAADVAARRGYPAGALRHGREGRPGPRPPGEIGMHAVRGGSWVGDHLVLLAGEGEWLELRHVAQDRAAFASGALAAARFVSGAGPGLYTLDHVLQPKGRG